MKKIFQRASRTLLIISPLCFAPAIALAQKLPDPLHGATIESLAKDIFQFAAFTVGPILVTIFIIVGAYQMLFSRGNAETFSKGKNTIVYTIIGYIVLLMAYGIVAIVKDILTP